MMLNVTHAVEKKFRTIDFAPMRFCVVRGAELLPEKCFREVIHFRSPVHYV
jgi:hypothetical protein